MQSINNNSYSSQGIQPINPYANGQINVPKPPVVNTISQNQYQTPIAQNPQAQQANMQALEPQQMQAAQPQQTQTVQPQAQAMPIYPQGFNIPSGGAVNINIFNPTTTNGAPVYPQNTYYTNPTAAYPNYVSQNVTVPQMPLPNSAYQAIQPQQQIAQTPVAQQPIAQTPVAQQPAVQMPQPQQVQAQNASNINEATAQNVQNQTQEQKTEQVVPLTDAYIKNLENYLNDSDPKVRLVGTTELLKRFKESDTRKSDPALTALLNKSLKDPSASVRQMALTTLSVGYAVGNDETIAILNNIQANKNDSLYAEDAIVAKEILLKLSGQPQEQVQNTPAGTAQV